MITVAVVGCGKIADEGHFPALCKMENVRIKYACNRTIERALRAKEKYPKIENAITDYRVAIADPEVDAVFVLTPNKEHYTVTMDALRAGKHVMCEKPVTVSYALALEMAEEAEKRGKILDIALMNRYNKSVELLREWVKEGRFGKLYHVYCSFRGFRNIPGLGGPFTTRAQSGGGVLIDWGIHFFDLILYVLDGARVKTASCDAYSEIAKDMKEYNHSGYVMWAENTSDIERGVNDVEDYVAGHIRTDKASITFNGAWAQNIKAQESYIDFLGDKGGARLTYGGKFEFYDGKTLATLSPEYDIPDPVFREDEAFLRSVATGEKDRNHIENILESTRLIDLLYRSAERKEEIKDVR